MIDNDRFVCYVDNFLDPPVLKDLQEEIINLNFESQINNDNEHYGFRYKFNNGIFKYDFILTEIKRTFFPNNILIPNEVSYHLRNNTEKPLVHVDTGSDYNFLLYLKGDPLLNNGTGFYTEDGNLSSHIGFLENRAIFFNGNKIGHTDLQSFGDSTPRYTLNIFYKKGTIQ